jgi:hypothetical protein
MDTTFTFPATAFPPLAVGFFGLGVGYLIYGPQELIGFPARSRAVDIATGIWGVWMPGFMQFVTGIFLFGGLVWFHSVVAPPLYMTALAFTAYGVHWWAMGLNRALQADPRPNAFMCIGFIALSVLGVLVFVVPAGRDIPVALLFVGLTVVYVFDFFASLGVTLGTRLLGLAHVVTGLWLMYLTYAATLNFAVGYKLWL